MKLLGIVGGIGPESTVDYYRLFISIYRERRPDGGYPPLLINSIDLQPMSIFGDFVVINELVIDQPEFTYETKIVSSNIKDLLKNIESFTGGGGQQPVAKDGKPRKFIVKKFRFTNGKARVELGANVLNVSLPPISLDDVGVAEGGITADQLSGILMRKVLGSVVEGTANAVKSGDLSVDQLKAAAKDAGDAIKKMFQKK